MVCIHHVLSIYSFIDAQPKHLQLLNVADKVTMDSLAHVHLGACMGTGDTLEQMNFRSWLKAAAVAAAAALLQSCPTLCNPIDSSPPGAAVPGILQGRILEWVAISFSNAWKWKVKMKLLSHVWSSATPWTAAYQAPPSMGFSRQENWSGVPLPSPS